MKAKLVCLAVALVILSSFGCVRRNNETGVKSGTGKKQEIKPVGKPVLDSIKVPWGDGFVSSDVKPAPLEAPYCNYPAKAIKEGREGKVIVQILLDVNGSVMQTRVAKSSGQPDLDEAATEGAKKFKFTPAMQHKRPVRLWVTIPFEFRLH